MARTYTNTPEPRKVLEADTIRRYSRETVEEALQGGGGALIIPGGYDGITGTYSYNEIVAALGKGMVALKEDSDLGGKGTGNYLYYLSSVQHFTTGNAMVLVFFSLEDAAQLSFIPDSDDNPLDPDKKYTWILNE